MIGSLRLFNPTYFNDRMDDLIRKFFEEHDSYTEGPAFVDTKDGYKMEIKVADVDIDNINVEVEDEKYITVSYFVQTENSSSAYSAKELLPIDADSSTIEADVVDGVLIIDVKKKEV